MRIEYVFDTDTAQLLYTTEYNGASIVRHNFKDPLYRNRAPIFVADGVDAEREFFNHFGDDSSWPDGWYSKLLKSKVTKASIRDRRPSLFQDRNHTI